MNLVGKKVKFTLEERVKPRSKKMVAKEYVGTVKSVTTISGMVAKEYVGTVKSVTTISGREVATVEVEKLLNGGFTISRVVDVDKLTVVED